MSDDLDRNTSTDDATSLSQRKSGIRRFVLTTVLVLGGLLVLVALLLPAVRTAREPARRASCQNKLKQLSYAIQNYAVAHGELPPAYTTDENGKPLHSWRTLILPYIEQIELYKSIDLKKPWDDPANAHALNTVVDEYSCPSRTNYKSSPGEGADNTTTYLAVVTPESCLQRGERRKLSDITDSPKRTVMLVEVDAAHAVPWMQPVDADEQMLLSLAEAERAHAAGFHAVFADGLVHLLEQMPTAAQWRALISIAGGEVDIGIRDPDAR